MRMLVMDWRDIDFPSCTHMDVLESCRRLLDTSYFCDAEGSFEPLHCRIVLGKK